MATRAEDRADAVGLLALAGLKGVGYSTLFALMENTGARPANILSTDSGSPAWAALKAAGARIDADVFGSTWPYTQRRLLDHGDAELALLSSMGVTVVFRGSPDYPRQLLDLKDAPHWLFVQGSPQVLAEPSVAAVGTRKPTADGLWLARFVGLCLGDWHAPTVSGLALGIDQEIHLSSIEQGVPTIAVLGTGILSDYPRNASELRKKIIEGGGAVITEYLPDETYSAQNFVHRNRIQAALSSVLVPVEWQVRSGTAHTVRYAHALGRPLAGLRLPHWYDEAPVPQGPDNYAQNALGLGIPRLRVLSQGMEELTKIARAIRTSLETISTGTIDWRNTAPGFEFPNGWCEDTARLVTRYLTDIVGLKAITVRADSPTGYHLSHVWTVVRGTIVDITADQAALAGSHPGAAAVIVTNDSSWHAKWNKPTLLDEGEEWPPELVDLWEHLLAVVRTQQH